MDPSFIPAPVYVDIWRYVTSNFKWALHILLRRKWLIIGVFVLSVIIIFLLRPKRRAYFTGASYRLETDSGIGKYSLEDQGKYLKYLNDVYTEFLKDKNLVILRGKDAGIHIYSEAKGLTLEVDMTNIEKKTRYPELDSLLSVRRQDIDRLAKTLLPAGLRLVKISDYYIPPRSALGIYVLGVLFYCLFAIVAILIVESFSSPWMKLKRAGLPLLGVIHRFSANANSSEPELLCIVQMLNKLTDPQAHQVIMFIGDNMDIVAEPLARLIPLEWRSILIDFVPSDAKKEPAPEQGLIEYLEGRASLKEITKSDEKGRASIEFNCKFPVEGYFALKQSFRLQTFFEELKSHSLVILRGIPLRNSPAMLDIIPFCTKVVLVHRNDNSTQSFYRALKLLKDNNAPLAGYVICDVPELQYIHPKFWMD